MITALGCIHEANEWNRYLDCEPEPRFSKSIGNLQTRTLGNYLIGIYEDLYRRILGIRCGRINMASWTIIHVGFVDAVKESRYDNWTLARTHQTSSDDTVRSCQKTHTGAKFVKMKMGIQREIVLSFTKADLLGRGWMCYYLWWWLNLCGNIDVAE